MDNQHRKIKGYRELSEEDIALMNAIKSKGAELLALQETLVNNLVMAERRKRRDAFGGVHAPVDLPVEVDHYTEHHTEYVRFKAAEPFRWASIGKTDIQTGIMALVRAVAQPDGV